MAKKPPRYPRKLRHTLEKIVEARDERQQAAADEKGWDPFQTLWREFLGRGSVHMMHTRIDEIRNRLVSRHELQPDLYHSRVTVAPPWTPRQRDGEASE